MKDVFLCHVAEDKDRVVRPLYEYMVSENISVWLDEAEIKWGDSITGKVNSGIKNSNYVIVVLSHEFIKKKWVFRELNSVLNIEASTGRTKILPLIVGGAEDVDTIFESLPLINDKSFLLWDGNPEITVNKLLPLLNRPEIDLNKGGNATYKDFFSLFLDYGFWGVISGVVVGFLTFSVINFMIIMVFSLIYGVVINFTFNEKINKLDFRAPSPFSTFKKKSKYINDVMIQPSMLLLPLLCGLIFYVIYLNSIALVLGSVVGVFLSISSRFKLSSVYTAFFFTIVGAVVGIKFGNNDPENLNIANNHKGAIGAVIGGILAIAISMIVSISKTVLGFGEGTNDDSEA